MYACWDKETWYHENYFAAVGVSVDPGNDVLSIIMLAIRHALGMEPLLESRACSTDLQNAAPRRPVGWPEKDDHRCDRHPLLAGATAAGISRKEGYMKPVSSLIRKGASPEECLRLVLASLAHDEAGQKVTLLQGISLRAQERLGNIIGAAGGVLGPYTPAAKSLMASMHTAHGTNQRSDTNALIKLSKIAVGVSEFTWMLHALNNSDGIDNIGDIGMQMFDVLHELRVDGAALDPVNHGDQCWICAEFCRIGGDDLLIMAEQKEPRKNIPTKKKAKNRGRDGRRPRVILKARARRKRSPSEQSDAGKIHPIQRTPETIIDTRLHEAEEKGRFRCDSCTSWFRGSYEGRLLPGVRELSFQEFIQGWQDGGVDASWCCVECWKIYFREERDWRGDTRARLGLPPASRLPAITDQRFHDKSCRWAWCDRCGSFCRGRARDYLYGSFVYGTNNQIAGPGHIRSTCFPKTPLRSNLWETGQWDATFACRACLPELWAQSEKAIESWLHMDVRRSGAYIFANSRRGREGTSTGSAARGRSYTTRRESPESRGTPERWR